MTHGRIHMNLYNLLRFRVIDPLGLRRKHVATNKGFTLVELIMVIALIGVLATMSLPLYTNYKEKAKIAAAISDIGVISNEITAYALDRNYNKPQTLAEIGRDKFLDPWKKNYEYRPNAVLKDEFGVFLNEQSFDIFSMGKDGLTADVGGVPETKDDVSRMGDGTYVGKREGVFL